MERRLATILTADLVGYSRLMAADEDGTIDRFRDALESVVVPAVAAGGGRIVKTTGDGVLAEFASAAGAVRAALAFQAEMVARERDRPPEARLRFRAGLTIGDVVVDGDDILGDGVNLAARLESACEPDGLAVSATLVATLPPDLRAVFEDAGEHVLKNLPAPVRIWRWRAEGAPSEPAPADAGPPTIAVTPFAKPGGDPDQDWFAEGLAEEVISALSHLKRLPVIAGASSAAAARESVTPRALARELGARYLVEGSVRRSGDRLRVIVKLIDGESGHALWSERYDRTLDDVFAIQDEIAASVVAALEPEVGDSELRRSRDKPTERLGAWERFLRGMAILRRQDDGVLAAARAEFKAAVEIDPDYGEAWSGLGWTHLKAFGGRSAADPQAALDAGFDAARRGVQLSEGSAFAHYVMSTAWVWRGDMARSMAELEQALSLNPYYVRAGMALGNRLELSTDRAEEGVAEMKRALRLSPHDPDRYWYFASLARALIVQGDAEAALGWIERAVMLRPEDPNMLYRRAVCLAALDRPEEARADLDACERLRPGVLDDRRTWRPYDDDERNGRLFDGLRRHGLVG